MELIDFKNHIQSFPDGTLFKYGISKPFSWRGSYDEVAFSIIEKPMLKEDILANIQLAYDEWFSGYKGGEYKYHDSTNVHFESGIGSWSDGEYAAEIIAKIEDAPLYKSQEERLVKITFC